jgi:site-specific recombinase XerD
MFEQLFQEPRVVARHRAAPLVDERHRYLVHLAEQGLSHYTLVKTANVLIRATANLDLAKRPGENISRNEVRRKMIDNRCRHVLIAVRWLEFLGRLQRPPVLVGPYAEKIKSFANHMRDERCLMPVTVSRRAEFLQQFLARVGDPNGSLRKISVAQVDAALLGMVSQDGYSRRTVQNWAGDVRAFLRYAEARGWCRKGIADAIKSPRNFSQATLPAGPSWNDVHRLLAMTEGDRPADIRDRAILMLLAIYGFRKGEVVRLRLDDFDWERELLSVVCPKTQRTRVYPLIRSVGDAVLRYLKEVRPNSLYREVFLTLLRPIRPLPAQLWGIVGTRLRRLGVSLPHHGAHALRHACATHLLTQGLSLKEIGDHLGHRHPNTTRIYAKVDLMGLRQVADFDLGGLL